MNLVTLGRHNTEEDGQEEEETALKDLGSILEHTQLVP